MQPSSIIEIQTPVGLARAHSWSQRPAPEPDSEPLLVLGHGAGGSSWTGDLALLTTLADDGWTVVLVEQPWRVAGRRVAARPAELDVAWSVVVDRLRASPPGVLVLGGRSAGARVACRTATALGAVAVLALSFPLRPPGRPEQTRAAEARLVSDAGLPLAVVQGRRDPFGTPEQVQREIGPGAEVYAVAGAHSLGRSPSDVLAAARSWLARVAPRS